MASGTGDVQEAFRRGVRGGPLAPGAPNGLAEEAAPFVGGANEAALLDLPRLPGLTDAAAAYETGRALRMIARLFDRAGAPERVGREFVANLVAAVVASRVRGTRAWGAADTVDMFVELHARVLGGRADDLTPLRRAVMDYAVGPGERGRRGGADDLPWYRRPTPSRGR